MTIQIPNVGTGVPADQTGDSPWLAMKKVRENFNDQTNAASRLVGEAVGNVMGVGAFGLGGNSSADLPTMSNYLPNSFIATSPTTVGNSNFYAIGLQLNGANQWQVYLTVDVTTGGMMIGNRDNPSSALSWGKVWTSKNATKDSNGFLKGASPVIDMYDNKIGLNQDAEQQGSITFEKLGVGDYLVKGSLGFAQEGWYIETPKDANGNVLVAVVYEQLANNDLSIKTYAKRFDDETGDIVANLAKPRDIPAGRFISLRLHELPKEPPVMPTETQPEV